MTLTALESQALDALLDTLLPGGSGFPPASAVGIGGWLAARGEHAQALRAILALLPSDFAAFDPSRKEALVKAIETDHPRDFEAFVAAAYAGYYTSLPVLDVIEAATGYHARPQPFGYALEPFDASIVAVPAKSPRSWRDTQSA